MKIRKGFVSNSSSSSFVCDISGDHEEGMDLTLEEAEMCECVEGHTFNESFLIGSLREYDEDSKEDDERYEVDKTKCPICCFKAISIEDFLNYLLKEKGKTKEQIIKTEIKKKFKNYNEFCSFIKD